MSPSTVLPPHMSTCVCSVAPDIPISPLKPLTNWHLGPQDLFSADTLLITKATGVLISTNNIVVFRHVVFDEVDFPLFSSPRLTNDLGIFL
jgi:hypothetical protein